MGWHRRRRWVPFNQSPDEDQVALGAGGGRVPGEARRDTPPRNLVAHAAKQRLRHGHNRGPREDRKPEGQPPVEEGRPGGSRCCSRNRREQRVCPVAAEKKENWAPQPSATAASDPGPGVRPQRPLPPTNGKARCPGPLPRHLRARRGRARGGANSLRLAAAENRWAKGRGENVRPITPPQTPTCRLGAKAAPTRRAGSRMAAPLEPGRRQRHLRRPRKRRRTAVERVLGAGECWQSAAQDG